jgi:hypothetical protein
LDLKTRGFLLPALIVTTYSGLALLAAHASAR